jgi:hypothetical protein
MSLYINRKDIKGYSKIALSLDIGIEYCYDLRAREGDSWLKRERRPVVVQRGPDVASALTPHVRPTSVQAPRHHATSGISWTHPSVPTIPTQFRRFRPLGQLGQPRTDGTNQVYRHRQ